MNRIGFMQGRLSPQVDGKIQSFPWEHWRSEFSIAQSEGFQVMEWIFEDPHHEENPLWTDSGLSEMRSLSSKYNIDIESVCADYFMTSPFFRGKKPERNTSRAVLERLIDRCRAVGARLLEIPMVDASRLRTQSEMNEVISVLNGVAPLAENNGITMTLETDLAPDNFRALLDRCPVCVKANFDMGNSASLDYDPEIEIKTLGPWIANVHVKDRVLGGSTVPLGNGNAEFHKVFDALKRADYQGSFVLQTARDRDDVGMARHYRRMVVDWLKEAHQHVGARG